MLNLKKGQYLGLNTKAYQTESVTITRTEYSSKVSEEWHYHEHDHISLILNGGNREERNSGIFDAIPGKVFFYNSGELHRNVHTQYPSCNINIEIKDEFFKSYELKNSSFQNITAKGNHALFTVLTLYKECIINDSLSPSAIHSTIIGLLNEKNGIPPEQINPIWIRTITELLNDRWYENLTLTEIAQEAQVHPVTISRLFPRHFGCTLGDYMRRLKVEKAFTLIKTTNLSLTEIAYLCGFFDQSHFTRTFLHITGFLPKVLQKL